MIVMDVRLHTSLSVRLCYTREMSLQHRLDAGCTTTCSAAYLWDPVAIKATSNKPAVCTSPLLNQLNSGIFHLFYLVQKCDKYETTCLFPGAC